MQVTLTQKAAHFPVRPLLKQTKPSLSKLTLVGNGKNALVFIVDAKESHHTLRNLGFNVVLVEKHRVHSYDFFDVAGYKKAVILPSKDGGELQYIERIAAKWVSIPHSCRLLYLELPNIVFGDGLLDWCHGHLAAAGIFELVTSIPCKNIWQIKKMLLREVDRAIEIFGGDYE
jgi:hypothetical protein